MKTEKYFLCGTLFFLLLGMIFNLGLVMFLFIKQGVSLLLIYLIIVQVMWVFATTGWLIILR